MRQSSEAPNVIVSIFLPLPGEEDEPDVIQRGGPGSGHFGHEGRPGKVGGSQPSDFHSAEMGEAENEILRVMREQFPETSGIERAAWLGPDGKFYGLEADHQESAAKVAHDILGYKDPTVWDSMYRVMEAGFTRISYHQPSVLGIDLPPGGVKALSTAQKEGLVLLLDRLHARSRTTGKELAVTFTALLKKREHNQDARQITAPQIVNGLGLSRDDWTYDTILNHHIVTRGGPGSGHFGHEGRPGKVGGSQPSDFHSGPDTPIAFDGFHTTIDNAFPFAQRGSGYYIALDRPFQPGAGPTKRVRVTLKASEILDPRDLLPNLPTDVEKSRAAWDEVYRRAQEMESGAHDWIDEHTGFKELGYRAEVGEIEPGHPEHGRELVIWYPEDIEEGDAITDEEAVNLAREWYAKGQAPDFHYAPSQPFIKAGKWNPDANLLYHWTDREGLDGVLDRLEWHAGSMTENPAYHFDQLNKAKFALVFDASKVNAEPAEKQVPWEEWEVVSKDNIELMPIDPKDSAFLGFGVRTAKDRASLQRAITKIYDPDWKDMWPIHLVPHRKPARLTERAVESDRPPKKESKGPKQGWRGGKTMPDLDVDRTALYLSLDMPDRFIVTDVEKPTDWKPEISNPLDGDKDHLLRWLGYNIRAYHQPEQWDLADIGERAGVINRIPTPENRKRVDFLNEVGRELEQSTLCPQIVALSEAATAAFGGLPIPRSLLVQGDPDATIEVLAKGKTISGVLGQMTLQDWGELTDGEKRYFLGEYYMTDAGLETGEMSAMLTEVVRVIYYDTKDVLEREGFKRDSTVRLYRGLVETPTDLLPSGMDGGWVNVEISNLSPWTFSPGVAAEYATEQGGRGSILAMDVPASMIFCNWETGPASRRWLSYLLLASREPMRAYLYPVQRARLRDG